MTNLLSNQLRQGCISLGGMGVVLVVLGPLLPQKRALCDYVRPRILGQFPFRIFGQAGSQARPQRHLLSPSPSLD